VHDNLFAEPLSKSSLVYLLVWSPPPRTPYISSPIQCLLFTTHAHAMLLHKILMKYCCCLLKDENYIFIYTEIVRLGTVSQLRLLLVDSLSGRWTDEWIIDVGRLRRSFHCWVIVPTLLCNSGPCGHGSMSAVSTVGNSNVICGFLTVLSRYTTSYACWALLFTICVCIKLCFHVEIKLF